LRAWIQAEKVKEANPNAYIRSYANQAHISFAKAKEVLYEPHVKHEADPNEKAVIKMWNYLRSVNYIQSNEDIRKHINTSLYKTALDQLTAENPKDKFYQRLQKQFYAQNLVAKRPNKALKKNARH
jgi:NitT/TauT family transport system substrate-binding protein